MAVEHRVECACHQSWVWTRRGSNEAAVDVVRAQRTMSEHVFIRNILLLLILISVAHHCWLWSRLRGGIHGVVGLLVALRVDLTVAVHVQSSVHRGLKVSSVVLRGRSGRGRG